MIKALPLALALAVATAPIAEACSGSVLVF